MSKKFKKFFAGLLAFVMVFAMTAVAAPKAEAKAAVEGTETVAINASVSYTGATTPGYTFDSSVLTRGGKVGAMVFNITVDLPAEGDVAWNDWCGEALAVHANGETKYYDFGGAQVGWGSDLTGDDTPDTTGVGTASWAGSVSAARTATVTVPVNAETFTIDFFDLCWDSAADITHYTIQSGTAVYGEISSMETVAIGQEMKYTGTAASGYTFDSSVLTTEGTAAYAVFNISIALPKEGDVAWNDWCGEAAKVTVGDKVSYYDFGGAQVGWGSDLTGDDTPDTTGVGTDSWAGSAENLSISAAFPINGKDFTVDFYDLCWDSAPDMTHYVINSVTVLYGGAANVVVEAPETVAVGQSLSYTGTTAPGYTFDSSVLTKGGKVGAMVFNITIDLPAEGDVAWNDWCGEALAVNADGTTKYYDFGGAQVGWGADLTGDDTPDTTGVGTASWAGSVTSSRNLTVAVPVNAETFTVDFYDLCWDSAVDIPHYTIHSATAVYGDVVASELVAINQGVSYTGLTTPGYTFDSSVLTTEGAAAYAAFNISIALPTEGDVAWNDWCGEVAKLTIGDTVKYFDFGGAQVGWGVDMTGDDTPDTTGVGTESWAGSAENLSISAVFPIGAEDFTIDFFDNCWDSATDIPHYTINSATILYGAAATSVVEVPEGPELVDIVIDPGKPYEGDMTVFLAMQGGVAAATEWDVAYINGSTDAGGVVPTMATNVKPGDTVTIGLSFPNEVLKTWYMVPVVVLNDADAGTVTTLDYTIDKITIDGLEVTPDMTLGDDEFWYEGTGDWTDTQAIRLKGGYNEYAVKFIEEPANYQEIMYTITFGEVVSGQVTTQGTIYDGEVTMFLAGDADRTALYDWEYHWSNEEDDTSDVAGTVVTAKSGDTVTLSLTYPEPVVHTWWLAPVMVFPEAEDGQDKYKVAFTIDKIAVDGNDITDKLVLDTTKELSWYEGAGNSGIYPITRTIRLGGGYNEYGADNAKALDGTLLEGYKTIEYTITLDAIYAEPKVEVEGPKVDKNGVYNAYMGIQSQNYTFRNEWNDVNYGKLSVDYPDVHNQMSSLATDESGASVLTKKPGTFKDVEIAGNGTYTLELTDLAWDDSSTDLNLLFISTDIPASGEITFSNIKVDFDGKNVMEMAEGFVNPESKEYTQVICINIWNKTVTAEYPMAGMLPNSNVKITFDVSGFDYDKAAEAEPTPEPTAAPTEAPEPTVAPTEAPAATEAPEPTATTAPTVAPTEAPAAAVDSEGGMSPVVIALIVVAVLAVAGGAAFVVMKKKK